MSGHSRYISLSPDNIDTIKKFVKRHPPEKIARYMKSCDTILTLAINKMNSDPRVEMQFSEVKNKIKDIDRHCSALINLLEPCAQETPQPDNSIDWRTIQIIATCQTGEFTGLSSGGIYQTIEMLKSIQNGSQRAQKRIKGAFKGTIEHPRERLILNLYTHYKLCFGEYPPHTEGSSFANLVDYILKIGELDKSNRISNTSTFIKNIVSKQSTKLADFKVGQ